MDVRTVDRVAEAQLLDTIGRWLERDVRPIGKEYDHADRYPTEIVEQMKAFGLFDATISPACGGLGLPATTQPSTCLHPAKHLPPPKADPSAR